MLTTEPRRIQRKRTTGWKMPPNTIYVGRPTKWGNPWTIESARDSGYFKPGYEAEVCANEFRRWLTDPIPGSGHDRLEGQRKALLEALPTLRGKDLACWCREGAPCHADVLLELANAEADDAS